MASVTNAVVEGSRNIRVVDEIVEAALHARRAIYVEAYTEMGNFAVTTAAQNLIEALGTIKQAHVLRIDLVKQIRILTGQIPGVILSDKNRQRLLTLASNDLIEVTIRIEGLRGTIRDLENALTKICQEERVPLQ